LPKNKYDEAMNEQNLLHGNPSTQFKSGREAVESGRAGGIASGISKREKKLLRESIMEAADMVAVMSDEEKQELITCGVNPNDVTNRSRFVAALWAMAGKVSKDGAQDRRLLMDASGEMTQKIDIGSETVEDFMEKVFGHD
jgi:hypothetical protein